MPQHQFVIETAPEWVSQLANEHGLGLIPWARLVCQALHLLADSSRAQGAAFAVSDGQLEHLLVWPELGFLSVRSDQLLSAQAASSPGGYVYSREDLALGFPGHPWLARQESLGWLAGRALPGAPGSGLGSLILFGAGDPPPAPPVQERLRAATALLAAALTGRPLGGERLGAALMSRRDFDLQLSRETRRSERSGQALGILLASLVARSRKHPALDTEIQRLGEAVARALRRGGDYVARYGSRSVAILLPDSDAVATAGTTAMLQSALTPLLAEINEQRAAPLSLKLATTSVRGYDHLAEDSRTVPARRRPLGLVLG